MTYRAKDLYKGEVAMNYDKERFSSLKGKLYSWLEKKSVLRALNNVPSAGPILDIPCGTGRITRYLQKYGYQVSGADVSLDMLKMNKKYTGLDLHEEDITKMKFADKQFDIITCVRMMGHLPPSAKRQALKEMKRVANYLVVTFYFKHKPNWYSIDKNMLYWLLYDCGLNVVSKHLICPGWSDGVTYLLHE